MSAPYAEDTESLLGREVDTLAAVAVRLPGATSTTPLHLLDGSVDYDERRAPRVEARLTCSVPPADVLDALDPRRGVRVLVDAGYRRPGGARDVHPLADLGLRSRTVERVPSSAGADRLTLYAAGDEALVIAAATVAATTPAQSTIPVAVADLLTRTLPAAPVIAASTLPPTAPGEVVTLPAGDRVWPVLDDLVDRLDGDVYDDGTRRWHIVARPAVAGVSRARLRTGAGGTIVRSSATTSADTGEGWANAVVLTYSWRDAATGNERTVAGVAQVHGAPYGVDVAGRHVYAETRERAASGAQAAAAARAVLARRLASGRTVALAARARYWLRPGHTVTVTLPAGGEDRLLVVAARYDLTRGEVDLDLRRPDDAPVTTSTIGA